MKNEVAKKLKQIHSNFDTSILGVFLRTNYVQENTCRWFWRMGALSTNMPLEYILF